MQTFGQFHTSIISEIFLSEIHLSQPLYFRDNILLLQRIRLMQHSPSMIDKKRREDEPKIMIFSLYAIQSFYFGFYSSLPLTYSSIPNYQTLSIFALAGLPYSFKFLMAPFQELYFFRSYGKRKTWIVGSLIILILTTSMMGMMAGQQQHQIVMAFLLMISILASAIKDVSTDALAVETISNLSTISTIQFVAEQIGQITTISIFLALVSKGYWSSFGINSSLISASTFIYGITAFIVFTTGWIHFKFIEKNDQHRNDSPQANLNFWEIICYFKHFLHPKYKICRISILFFLQTHGLLYFSSTFEIEMIRRQYIERQSIMFMRDFSIVLSLISCYFLGKYLQNKRLLNYSWYFSILLFVICYSAFIFDPKEKWLILFLQIVIKMSRSFIYYVHLCLIKEYSKGLLLGVNITTLLSIRNLGSNTSIQNQLIYLFQYNNAMKIGFFIAFITLIVTPFFNKWIDQGQIMKTKPKQSHED